MEASVADKLAEALCLNNQVHALQCKADYTPTPFKYGGPFVHDLQEDVMRVLMRDSQGQHPITALNCLHLQYTQGSNKSLICEFIKTTKCLTDLQINEHLKEV